jgi:hypothetical protein
VSPKPIAITTIYLGRAPMQLTLTYTKDGKDTVLMDHVEVREASLKSRAEGNEIRTNQRAAAAAAGAPPEVWQNLPGEQITWNHTGTVLEITYVVRVVMDGTGLGEPTPAMPT